MRCSLRPARLVSIPSGRKICSEHCYGTSSSASRPRLAIPSRTGIRDGIPSGGRERAGCWSVVVFVTMSRTDVDDRGQWVRGGLYAPTHPPHPTPVLADPFPSPRSRCACSRIRNWIRIRIRNSSRSTFYFFLALLNTPSRSECRIPAALTGSGGV